MCYKYLEALNLSAKTRYWCWLKFFHVIAMLQKNCVIKEHFYKSYTERHCQILFVEKFQAANLARFGDMVYNVLPKWPFISVMQSHFENQIN